MINTRMEARRCHLNVLKKLGPVISEHGIPCSHIWLGIHTEKAKIHTGKVGCYAYIFGLEGHCACMMNDKYAFVLFQKQTKPDTLKIKEYILSLHDKILARWWFGGRKEEGKTLIAYEEQDLAT